MSSDFEILYQFCKCSEDALPWETLKCKNGNTQRKERTYIPKLRQVIEYLGGKIGREASSQEAMDFQEVQLPYLYFIIDMDGKSTNCGFVFKFNDSLPKPDGYYIFIHVGLRRVIVKTGQEIFEYLAKIKCSSVETVTEEIRQRQEFINQNKYCRIGTTHSYIDSYARPSWSVKLPSEWFGVYPKKSKKDTIKEIETLLGGRWPRRGSADAKRYEHFCTKGDNMKKLTFFLESLTQPPFESRVEERRSPIEQPDLSMSPPSHSPLEIPESV